MAEEKITPKVEEKKVEEKPEVAKPTEKAPTTESSSEKLITDNKIEKEEAKPVETPKTEEKKVEAPKKLEGPKKTEAVVNAKSLPISTKHSIAICNMIRGKDIDQAISLLEMAEMKKIPVPMRGEIPHRKGIMSGRFPVNALGHFIKTLKSLKSNALVNELELEKYEIFCKANLASRPYRRFGKGKFKRTHLTVKLIPIKIKKKNSKNKSKETKK